MVKNVLLFVLVVLSACSSDADYREQVRAVIEKQASKGNTLQEVAIEVAEPVAPSYFDTRQYRDINARVKTLQQKNRGYQQQLRVTSSPLQRNMYLTLIERNAANIVQLCNIIEGGDKRFKGSKMIKWKVNAFYTLKDKNEREHKYAGTFAVDENGVTVLENKKI
ncbi:hypothetical protein [Mucilaginibacter sp. CSA2-8R]|uniref:hypothetical protein n=1 Tax=Mucilaginibacter sp. CSA2-8R TaxID=3141542 RepID=UPI00315D7672